MSRAATELKTERAVLVRWEGPQRGLDRLPTMAGIDYTSIEIKTNSLRPVSDDSGPLECAGRVAQPGRRVTFAEGEVTDRHGRTVATASGTLLIFPPLSRPSRF